jgi:hypothetical protein
MALISSKIRLNTLHWSDIFFMILLLELFMGGGGRLLDIGTLSVRMYFFMAATGLSLLYLIIRQHISLDILVLLAVFTLLHGMAFVVAYANNVPMERVLLDFKPLSFFYIILFFSYKIRRIEDVLWVVDLIRIAALLLAVIYLIVFVLLNLRLINFALFWHATYASEEFFFRGQMAFLYKGFVYLVIGFFFLFRGKHWQYKAFAVLLALATFLTFTRGFIVAWGVTYIIYLALFGKNKILILIFSLIIPILVLLAWQYTDSLLGDKMYSDGVRFLQVYQVLDMVTPYSVILGHGLGVGIGIRDLHMEVAYLEIFHKQGIIGLAFWGGIFLVITWKFAQAVQKGNLELALPFFLAVVFMYVESVTNPFLLSPLGMGLVLLAWVCLSVLSLKTFQETLYPLDHSRELSQA